MMSMASANTDHNPERVPSLMPARLPAADTSWHGKPPHRMSTGSTVAQSISVTLPRFGTSGQRCANTFDAALSISACHNVVPPNTASTAISKPPAPENNDPILMPAIR